MEENYIIWTLSGYTLTVPLDNSKIILISMHNMPHLGANEPFNNDNIHLFMTKYGVNMTMSCHTL